MKTCLEQLECCETCPTPLRTILDYSQLWPADRLVVVSVASRLGREYEVASILVGVSARMNVDSWSSRTTLVNPFLLSLSPCLEESVEEKSWYW